MPVQKLVVLQGNGAPNNQLYDRGVSPWALLGTMGTIYRLTDMLTFTGVVLIANGYETPWRWDGATFRQLEDQPGTGSLPLGASHHALHQGYYWLWNTASTSSTFDGPSSLRASDLNNPDSWPVASQLFIDKDDGQEGMGMGQFTIAETGISPTTSQILFKNYSSYQMTGVFGSTNPAFAVQKIKSDMGCVAPRTIKFAPGFGLIRLTHRGFALFDGVQDRLISLEMNPLIFGSQLYTPIDWANVAASSAEVVPNPPLYVAACPVPGSGGGLVRYFCYDLVRRAWSLLDYPAPIATIQTITDPGVLPFVLTGGFNNGQVRQVFSGDSDDVGSTPIAWQLATKPAWGSTPQANAYFRRLVLKVTNVFTGQIVSCTVIIGPVTPHTPQPQQKNLIVTASVGQGVGYGVQTYGTSPYGGVAGLQSEGLLTSDVGLIGTDARAIFTGLGPITIRGLEWHTKPKPIRLPNVFSPAGQIRTTP